jgi:hypothetical protein
MEQRQWRCDIEEEICLASLLQSLLDSAASGKHTALIFSDENSEPITSKFEQLLFIFDIEPEVQPAPFGSLGEDIIQKHFARCPITWVR